MTNATATDTHLPNKTLQTDGLSREEVRGRSAGIIVGAVMGLTWAGSALLTLNSRGRARACRKRRDLRGGW